MPLKTLFLNPPSFENFDGGASSRWPATREIESYWYPVWLAYPAGMLEGSRLLDASAAPRRHEETIEIGKDYEFLVLFTRTPGFPGDMQDGRGDESGESEDEDRLRRPARHHAAGSLAEGVPGDRFRVPSRVRLRGGGVRQRQAAHRDQRHQLSRMRMARSFTTSIAP